MNIPEPFILGILDGHQQQLFGGEEKTYLQDKGAIRLGSMAKEIGWAKLSVQSGITIGVLMKLKSGEWKASPYWWSKFFKKYTDI